MHQAQESSTPQQYEEHRTAAAPAVDKQPWHEPKLTFVEPKLTPQGDLKQVTGAGFFGGFTP